MKYGVYKVFLEEDGLKKYLWGVWDDEFTANEVGLEIQGDGYFTEVIAFETDPPKYIEFKSPFDQDFPEVEDD